MSKLIFSFLLFFAFQFIGISESYSANEIEYTIGLNEWGFSKLSPSDTISKKEFNKIKLTAVTLALTLGVFGVHRLYLGTKANVPIIYTLTLGGGFFVLPVIDIVYILTAKELSQLQNNDYVFMWNKKKKEIKPP